MKNAIYHPKSWILFVILLTYSFGALAQSITINGIVKDSTGEGIIGANVLQKGTTNGTVTDLDGNFTLTVPDKNAVLVFSFLGYVSQEVIVGNQTTLNIILKEDTQNLDEVIVIGYCRKRSIPTHSERLNPSSFTAKLALKSA